MPFDVNQAAEYIDQHALAASQGQCALHVRLAIQAGGTTIDPHPFSARDYGPYLTSNGFSPVPQAGYVPAKGDVVVIQNDADGQPDGAWTTYPLPA